MNTNIFINNIFLYIKNLILLIINILIFFSAYITITLFIPIILLIIKPFLEYMEFNNLWELNSKIFIYYLLNIKPNIIYKSPLIKKGFILPNHRSWLDFSYDPYITKSSIIGRKLAFYAVLIFSILGYIENRILLFSRGKTSRKEIYEMMKYNIETNYFMNKYGRVTFFPEGTRNNYNKLNNKTEIYDLLKKGLLKEIYTRNEYPVQLFISNNKDSIFNEKKLIVKRGLVINSILSDPIYPSNFNTFEDFLNKISTEWFECWELTHKSSLSTISRE